MTTRKGRQIRRIRAKYMRYLLSEATGVHFKNECHFAECVRENMILCELELYKLQHPDGDQDAKYLELSKTHELYMGRRDWRSHELKAGARSIDVPAWRRRP